MLHEPATVAALREELATLPRPARTSLTTREAVAQLADVIRRKRAEGVSWGSIAEFLTTRGVRIAETTLRTYYRFLAAPDAAATLNVDSPDEAPGAHRLRTGTTSTATQTGITRSMSRTRPARGKVTQDAAVVAPVTTFKKEAPGPGPAAGNEAAAPDAAPKPFAEQEEEAEEGAASTELTIAGVEPTGQRLGAGQKERRAAGTFDVPPDDDRL